MFQIDLSPEGELWLYLPTGRTLTISPSPEGIAFILKILRDHHQGLRKQKGYVKGLPTQHNIEQWIKENAKKKEEEKKEKVRKDLGIDLDKLEISI